MYQMPCFLKIIKEPDALVTKLDIGLGPSSLLITEINPNPSYYNIHTSERCIRSKIPLPLKTWSSLAKRPRFHLSHKCYTQPAS